MPAAPAVNGSLAVSDLHGGAGEYEYSSGRLKEWIDSYVEGGRMLLDERLARVYIGMNSGG